MWIIACPNPRAFFFSIEVLCVVIFTVDYVLRIGLVHKALPEDSEVELHLHEGRCYALAMTFKYAIQPLNIIDFLAVAPFYFELAGGANADFAIVRILRLVRLFRLLRSARIRLCADMFVNVLRDAMPALVTLFFMSTLMCVLFAAFLVFAERSEYTLHDFPKTHPTGVYVRPTSDGYGKEVSPFTSIPFAFWWFFVTSTTVGYGDECPTTTVGRIIAVFAFYLGICLLALPLTIVGQSFDKFYPQWVRAFQGLEQTEEQGGALRAAASLLVDDAKLLHDGVDMEPVQEETVTSPVNGETVKDKSQPASIQALPTRTAWD